jgi:hypothetical protein
LVERKTALTFAKPLPTLGQRLTADPADSRLTTTRRIGMRIKHTRSAAAITAIAAGSAAVYALQPADKPIATLAAHTPAVVYRTQVIRRTIHVIRHEHAAHFPAPRGAVATGGRGASSAGRPITGASKSHAGSSSGASGAAVSGAVATRTSGSHAAVPVSASAGPSGGAVTTRSSGASHAVSGTTAPASGSRPVTTRASGASHAVSGTTTPASGSHPVTTRTSGGASHSSSGSSVKTRTSGGGEGKDHGDGGGDN